MKIDLVVSYVVMPKNKKSFESTSAEQTRDFSRDIGSRLRGGEIIILSSDLGGGKTTFTQGLAEGVGSKDQVSSPTFTIANIYKGPNFDIHHLDFYRLNSPGIMADELKEKLDDERSVIIIEWADIVKDILPQKHIYIEITNKGDDNRLFKISFDQSFDYLFGEL